jgi:hypothetical protein
MLKKIMVLGAAIAAIAALVAPAAQADDKWYKGATAIGVDEVVTFTGVGNFELVGGAAGAHAEITATIKTKAGTLVAGGSAGEVTEFHIKNCTGTGQLNGLPCTSTATAVNWPVTFNANTTVTISVNLHQIYYADGAHTVPVSTTTLAGPVIIDLDTPGAISSATLTAGAGLLANGNAATVNGQLFGPGGWSLKN